MKASVLSYRPPAGVSISGRSGRECARTRMAPKASSTSSSSSSSIESDHLAVSRRRAAALLLASGASASLSLLLGPGPAEAAASSPSAAAPAAPTLSSGKRGIAAYVRKRRLDPLSSYVPAVLAAREQLAGLEGLVASDPVEARIELRSGAFEGLRDNVRAVGEYAAAAAAAAAESSGNGSGGSSGSSSSSENNSAKSFFASVQKLDYELFAAAREKRDPSSAAVEALRAGVAALDALLATVPAADLDEARRLVATAAEVEKKSSSSSTTTTAGAAAAIAADGDDEKLRRLVPGAAR